MKFLFFRKTGIFAQGFAKFKSSAEQFFLIIDEILVVWFQNLAEIGKKG